MIEATSPLHTINQKELELRRRVEAAQGQAEARLQAAHQEAQKIMAQAEQEGRTEAEAIFQRGVEEARQQAEAIVAAAVDKAATLRARAMTRLDEVAERIVELVLPAGYPPGF
ncbi:MAG: V-type ATPase subunit subunit G family protein [Chloroflexota bacterium]